MAAAATLLLELAGADETLSPSEMETVTGYLQERWALAGESVRRPGTGSSERGTGGVRQPPSRRDYRKPEREALMGAVALAACSDGVLKGQEERLMPRAGILLGVS